MSRSFPRWPAAEAVCAKLKRSLETSSLFDPVDAARKLEPEYCAMHERHKQGLPPDHIYIQGGKRLPCDRKPASLG